GPDPTHSSSSQAASNATQAAEKAVADARNDVRRAGANTSSTAPDPREEEEQRPSGSDQQQFAGGPPGGQVALGGARFREGVAPTHVHLPPSCPAPGDQPLCSAVQIA